MGNGSATDTALQRLEAAESPLAREAVKAKSVLYSFLISGDCAEGLSGSILVVLDWMGPASAGSCGGADLLLRAPRRVQRLQNMSRGFIVGLMIVELACVAALWLMGRG